ncbi:hypothetical protein Tco_0434821 [Tanacetum coccineum]
MVLRELLMKSGLVSVNTARQVNAAHLKTIVNAARPMSYLTKTVHSTVKRPIQKKTAFKNSNINQWVNTAKAVNTARPKAVNTTRTKVVNTARPKAVVNAVKGNNVNDVKAPACAFRGLICANWSIGNQSQGYREPASAIAISSDSSDESVGSPPSWVILFGDIPTVIPSTLVVAPETSTIAPIIFHFPLMTEMSSQSTFPHYQIFHHSYCIVFLRVLILMMRPPSQNPYVASIAHWRRRGCDGNDVEIMWRLDLGDVRDGTRARLGRFLSDSSGTRDGIVRSFEDMLIYLDDVMRDSLTSLVMVRIDRIVRLETGLEPVGGDQLIASGRQSLGWPRGYIA